jgi:hypothetical protein
MNEPDFQKHAQNAFRFLVERCGFAQTTGEPSMVRYTSKDVMVEVNYSGRGEVDVIIDEDPPSYRFQLSLFLHAFHPEVWKKLGDGIAYSDDEVQRELKRLSDAMQRYGKPLLAHDRQAFEKMKTVKWWELPS